MAALVTRVGWMVATVVVVGLGLVFWAGAGAFSALATMAAVSGGGLLALAWVRGRRESGQIRLRHCLECGASVLEKASICPRCQSVQLEAPEDDEGAAGGSGRAGRRREGSEMPVSAYSPDSSGAIGWVDSAPPGSWGSAEGMRPRVLRRWGVGLLAA